MSMMRIEMMMVIMASIPKDLDHGTVTRGVLE